jgi:hypothetical protein
VGLVALADIVLVLNRRSERDMVKQDFEHLSQVIQSVRFQVTDGKFPADEYDRLIERMMWAIHASPGGSPEFNSEAHKDFILRCKPVT